MILYPTIELQNGHCVSLNRGNLDEPLIWHVDPAEKAREFAAAGAEWIQVTDFNAIVGDDQNVEIVEEIIRSAGIPVQVAGGIRTVEKAEEWIGKGAGRVVTGTMAALEPNAVKALAKLHPDQVVLAVDVWEGRVMTEGWQKSSALEPEAFIRAFDGVPLAAILITDIGADLAEREASLSLISALAGISRTPVIASGLVRTSDDVSRLKYVGNIDGAIIGRALFRKTIDLDEALTVARPEREKTAEFI